MIRSATRDRLKTSHECFFRPPYAIILGEEQFLQLDGVLNYPAHVMIFYRHSRTSASVSKQNNVCDYDFKRVPRIYNQLYALHDFVQDYLFPLCMFSL